MPLHLRPTLTHPRPPTCALSLRSLSLFRVVFMSCYLLSLIIERIPDVLSHRGTRSENLAPSDWIKQHTMQKSIFFHGSYPLHAFFLSVMIALSICVLLGVLRTPATLLLWYMDFNFIQRNPMANDEHVLLVNRMFLALAFTHCDDASGWWSCEKRRSSSSEQKKRRQYDNTWASALIFTSIVMLWLQIGLEKLLDWDHWWIKADAMQMLFWSNFCVRPLAPMLRYLQTSLPRLVSQWFARIVVLIEFPIGPLCMLCDSDQWRMAGLASTGAALIAFGSVLEVGVNFPASVFVIQLALIPDSFMRTRCGTRKSDQVEDEQEEDPEETVTVVHTLPSISPNLPVQYATARTAVQRCIQSFMAMCVFGVVFCGCKVTVSRRPGGVHTPILTERVDHAVYEYSRKFSLATSWSAGSPPPTSINWNVVIGTPLHNSTWSIDNNDPHTVGISVQFRETNYDYLQETKRVTHASFLEPPDGHYCSGHRQFSVWREKYYGGVLTNSEFTALPRERILQQACNDFHHRHPLPEEKVTAVYLYLLWQEILDPWGWELQLGPANYRYIGHIACP